MKPLYLLALVLGLLSLALPAYADQVQVAVASNFAKPLEEIAAQFKTATGHEAKISTGATGKLYAQIEHGAPFEVFISADSKTPQKLLEAQLAVVNSQFTYAVGKLALWSAKADFVDEKGEILKSPDKFQHLAIANPKTAPYGTAALQLLEKLDLAKSLQAKFVQGENISQTFDFVTTDNAELGFVAVSQIEKDGVLKNGGSTWLVPTDLYDLIAQDAVLLTKGKDNKAAQALLDYLKTPEAQAIITSYGYALPLAAENK